MDNQGWLVHANGAMNNKTELVLTGLALAAVVQHQRPKATPTPRPERLSRIVASAVKKYGSLEDALPALRDLADQATTPYMEQFWRDCIAVGEGQALPTQALGQEL